MITLPQGFDYSSLFTDLCTGMAPFVEIAVLIGVACIVKMAFNKL